MDREEIVDNRLRRYYRLTPAGSGRLAAEAARLQANAAAALSRLATPRPGLAEVRCDGVPGLERGYRRLLAYIRGGTAASRGEILGVLMAGAGRASGGPAWPSPQTWCGVP